ncbi:MAG: hypothetical protein LBD85_03415 [Oscillospiraceae bacterium]|jgi:hypothetical protein|nr:hypothetical protein [Oscillospiraceae bacterium]MDR2360317.1 hypothetical protein [Oscillospiraceae bacterium]
MGSLPGKLFAHRGKTWYLAFLIVVVITWALGSFGGIEYGTYSKQTPVSIETAALVSGAYVAVPWETVLAEFARYGNESAGYSELSYVAAQAGNNETGSIIAVRLNRGQRERFDEERGSVFGTLLPSDPEITELLRNWTADNFRDKDEAFIAAHTPELTLYIDYMGSHHKWIGMIIRALFWMFSVASAILIIRILLLNFKIYDYADYPDGKDFGKQLHIAKQNVWIFPPFNEFMISRTEITNVVPRNKRMEGGKLSWSVAFVTKKKVYSAKVGDQETAVAAADYYKATVHRQSAKRKRELEDLDK